jgi:hypothetical protein
MSGRILLDLNFPKFQDELLALEGDELRIVVKALRKLRSMEWNALYQDHGFKWEAIKFLPGKFTIRLSKRSRAVVLREGDFIRFMALHTDHDSAYGKK